MESERRTLVILAAFSKEGSIGRAVEEVKGKLLEMDVLVVNTSDLTSEHSPGLGVRSFSGRA